MTKKISGNCQLKLAITSGVIMTVISFFLGFYWNTGRFLLFGIPKDIFTCLSYNNVKEAYQMDCFLPISKKSFILKETLDCTAYTNQGFSHNIWRKQDPERNNMTFIKSDYVTIKLEFKDNKIIRSSIVDGRKYEYNIIHETKDIIQGIYFPSTEVPNPFDTEHFITLSKNYGKGMEVWHNKEWYGDASIGSFFFQCE